MLSNRPLLYVVFDRFPAPKGASIHIAAFARALGEAFGAVELVTLPGESRPEPSPAMPGVHHATLAAAGATLIDRVMAFRRQLARHIAGRRFAAIHFRSIFEGYPIAREKERFCEKLIFEVNGLPSIELKYHYPAVADDAELLGKLRAQEQCCINAADLLITVSEVTARHLIGRGADPARIRVIPNGVDLSIFNYAAPTCCADRAARLLYSGTLASWQGVDRAVEALALLNRDRPATLTLVGTASRARKEDLLNAADALGVREKLSLREPISQTELAALYHAHDIAIVPLLCNDRNVAQGCCPLKMLEAMAAGTPVVASDLPVARALAADDAEATFVRPGSAKGMKDAVLALAADFERAKRQSIAARQRVEANFTWRRAGDALVEAYAELGLDRQRQSREAEELAAVVDA